jgi:mannose-1-phosphate guanylyltransferase
MSGRFTAIIPAGGSGTRLWPLSRAGRPKFLLPLPGPRTMIQETVHRLARVADQENIMIITGSHHVEEVRRQLPEVCEDQFIAEPLPRGSGPAIGLGAAIAMQRDPDAIVGSFAADHIVTEPEVFENAVRAAIDVAERGYLVTIGIAPSYAETGYGYIRAGETIGEFQGLEVCEVAQFKEKPDLATAQEYVASRKYLWNASMFVWKASVLLEEMRQLLPDLADTLHRIAADWDTPRRYDTLNALWPSVEDVTIDNGILEHSTHVAVVPGTFGWTDLGDWHGFGALAAPDPHVNTAINAELLARDSEGTFVFGKGRLVAIVGVDNVVVIDTDDALLVCDRARAQEVRYLVEELKRRGSTELI